MRNHERLENRRRRLCNPHWRARERHQGTIHRFFGRVSLGARFVIAVRISPGSRRPLVPSCWQHNSWPWSESISSFAASRSNQPIHINHQSIFRCRREQNGRCTVQEPADYHQQVAKAMPSSKHGSSSGGGDDPFKNTTPSSMSKKLKEPKKKRGDPKKREEEQSQVGAPKSVANGCWAPRDGNTR